MLKFAVAVLALLALALQYKAWFSDVGYFAGQELRSEIIRQQARADDLTAQNESLIAEVSALKSGNDAIEALARTDLGMVKAGEQYYLVTEPAAP